MKKYSLRNYNEYIKDNPKGLWFKMKLYGWGWVPVSWQGWTVILVFVTTLLLNGFYLESKLPTKGTPAPFDLAVFFAVFAISIIALFWICYKKGERPRWRWGK